VICCRVDCAISGNSGCRTSSSAAAMTCIGERPGPAAQDLSVAKRHAERGLGLRDPARGVPQRGSLKLSAVDEYPDVHGGHGDRGY
jgi:hypothetical protein